MTLANGDIYEGSFVNGLREDLSGEAKYSWKVGSVYTGKWSKGF